MNDKQPVNQAATNYTMVKDFSPTKEKLETKHKFEKRLPADVQIAQPSHVSDSSKVFIQDSGAMSASVPHDQLSTLKMNEFA